MIVEQNVNLDLYSSSITTMCVQSLSGISYIDMLESNGIEVKFLPSPVYIKAYRGENNDPIGKEPG